MARNVRSLLVWFLVKWNDLKLKHIGAPSGMTDKRVSNLLGEDTLSDLHFERFRAAAARLPGQVPIVEACHEALAALEQPNDLPPEVRAELEVAVLKAGRLLREGFTAALLRARPVPVEGYPEPALRLPARRWAAYLWDQFQHLEEEKDLLDVIRFSRKLQTWALCELLCEATVREASRDLERAALLARVAKTVAEVVRGPEGWLRRLKAFALAHWANVLRVQGDLKAADAELEKAKLLWKAGSDPDGVLDPGRLLHFEASLRRDQRRFPEALALLDDAGTLSYPQRALISKGFTFEVMGDYERAIETLLRAEPLVDRQSEPRDWYNLHFNLAVNYCHLGGYSQSAALAALVRDVAAGLGDEIFISRVTWLQGRIAAGLGQAREARRFLEQARRDFAERDMFYDVALALLEESALLLDVGRHADVKALVPELARVFDSKEVHREALAALRLFQAVVEREEATAGLARSILRYLFRARYDQDLPFNAS